MGRRQGGRGRHFFLYLVLKDWVSALTCKPYDSKQVPLIELKAFKNTPCLKENTEMKIKA